MKISKNISINSDYDTEKGGLFTIAKCLLIFLHYGRKGVNDHTYHAYLKICPGLTLIFALKETQSFIFRVCHFFYNWQFAFIF